MKWSLSSVLHSHSHASWIVWKTKLNDQVSEGEHRLTAKGAEVFLGYLEKQESTFDFFEGFLSILRSLLFTGKEWGQGSLKYQTIEIRMISLLILLGEHFRSSRGYSCSSLPDNEEVFRFLPWHLVGLASRDLLHIRETRSCLDRHLQSPLWSARLTYVSKS